MSTKAKKGGADELTNDDDHSRFDKRSRSTFPTAKAPRNLLQNDIGQTRRTLEQNVSMPKC